MAQPNTRSELINYAKRQLGAPVLEINVADEQVEDEGGMRRRHPALDDVRYRRRVECQLHPDPYATSSSAQALVAVARANGCSGSLVAPPRVAA